MNEQEAVDTTAQTTILQEQEVQRGQHRMIFYALMEAAMTYREKFWQEDVQDNYSNLKEQAEKYSKEKSFAIRKKYENRVKGMHLSFERDHMKFNHDIYLVLERLQKNLPEETKKVFDNYASSFGLVAEEVAVCKNTTELLTLIKLYNSGELEGIFNDMHDKEKSNGGKPPFPIYDEAGDPRLMSEQEKEQLIKAYDQAKP